MKKHFVEFFSPGTFVAETNVEEIDKWDVDKAVEIAKTILQRYNARPYGFRFLTRVRGPFDFDSHEAERSNMYYLGGSVETYQEIKDRNDPKDEILLSNMKNNGYNRVITNTNSWRWTQPLKDDDVILDVDMGAWKADPECEIKVNT